MTKEALAEKLNGRQYLSEISDEEAEKAEVNDLVVCFGASDDLIEFRGAIYEELSAYSQGDVYIIKKKKEWTVIDETTYDEVAEQIEEYGGTINGHKITFFWDELGYSWIYETNIPHATFEIIDEEDKYCRGIVFSLKDLAQ